MEWATSFNVTETGAELAVSYTHLDVYKRQGLHISVKIIAEGLCEIAPVEIE